MTESQLALDLYRQKPAPKQFLCVDPEGKGRPWNGKGRRPDYVKRHLRETGLYPVAKPDPETPSAMELARLNARDDALLELFTKHVREMTKVLEGLQRRLEVLEHPEPMRRAA